MRLQLLTTYAMTLDQARKLVAAVPCERFAELPHEGAKHPGWVLGHLVVGSYYAGQLLGASDRLGEAEPWFGNCTPGSVLSSDRASYGTKDGLLASLERMHAAVAEGLRNVTDEQLDAPLPQEEFRSFWPKVADGVVYLVAYHEGFHLGQLSSWRRAAGFGALPD